MPDIANNQSPNRISSQLGTAERPDFLLDGFAAGSAGAALAGAAVCSFFAALPVSTGAAPESEVTSSWTGASDWAAGIRPLSGGVCVLAAPVETGAESLTGGMDPEAERSIGGIEPVEVTGFEDAGRVCGADGFGAAHADTARSIRAERTESPGSAGSGEAFAPPAFSVLGFCSPSSLRAALFRPRNCHACSRSIRRGSHVRRK